MADRTASNRRGGSVVEQVDTRTVGNNRHGPIAENSAAAAPSGFIPYPNPRYSMAGGMQTMGGGA